MRTPREYPRVSVYLGAAGLIVQVVSAFAIYFLPGQEGSLMWNLMGPRGMAAVYVIMGHSGPNALLLTLVVTVALFFSSLFSIILLMKGTLSAVRIGSILIIGFGLMSATTTFGLVLGAVLMFVSGFGGIIWAYRRAPHL